MIFDGKNRIFDFAVNNRKYLQYLFLTLFSNVAFDFVNYEWRCSLLLLCWLFIDIET